MSKKQLDTSSITNELAGGASLFFSKQVSPSPEEKQPEPIDAKKTKKSPLVKEFKEELHEVMKPPRHEVMTSSSNESNLRNWKDLIENTETHNTSLRLTNEENYAVEDVVNELKRVFKIKTSLNEVARLGLLNLIHDFNTNREKSIIYKVKKS